MDPMSGLERELTTAVQVEPSAGFAARVRTQIAREAIAPRWRVPRLALVTGSLALIALAANLSSVRPASIPSADIALPHQNLAVMVPLRAAMPSSSPRVVIRQEMRPMTDVLVSRSEMLALRRLFSGEIVAPLAGDVPDEISIPMIAVDAITLPAIPGDRQ